MPIPRINALTHKRAHPSANAYPRTMPPRHNSPSNAPRRRALASHGLMWQSIFNCYSSSFFKYSHTKLLVFLLLRIFYVKLRKGDNRIRNPAESVNRPKGLISAGFRNRSRNRISVQPYFGRSVG